MALGRDLCRRGGGTHQQPRRVARREPQEEEHQGDHAEDDGGAGEGPAQRRRNMVAISCLRVRRPPGRYLPACLDLSSCSSPLVALAGCQPAADRRGATVLFASGADLQSINPLLTLHPLARQVQRYVLLTTLARYDAGLVPQPYLARSGRWSRRPADAALHLADRRALARRRPHHRARRGLDPGRRARSRDRLSPPRRAGGARAGSPRATTPRSCSSSHGRSRAFPTC